jgi:ferrochelatase
MNDTTQYAILMMAYGGPDSLDDIEDYLLDIRGGRRTPPELVEEITERYAAIGGRSPLLDITRAQASALEVHLNEQDTGTEYRVYVGMRHWHPYIKEAVAQIGADGIRRMVGICMAPHYSRMSIGAYIRKAEEAQVGLGVDLEATYIESWHDHPLFLQAIADKVKAGLRKFPADERRDVQVVFTAHSLPVAIMEHGDPYDEQLRATAQAVARMLEDVKWQFSYQSAGASNDKWLGPQLEDVVVDLAQAGHRNILVAPIGFVADHVEILYDIDIEARSFAEAAGTCLERTDSLNVTPIFVEALADIIRQHVASPRVAAR